MGDYRTKRCSWEHLHGCHTYGTSLSFALARADHVQAFYAVVNLLAYICEGLWIFTAPLLGYRYPSDSPLTKILDSVDENARPKAI